MGSYKSCSNWDYEDHPQVDRLTARCNRLVAWIKRSPTRFDRYGFDTRHGHRFMFAPMVPSECTCIAGRYRGDPSCTHIRNFNVGVGGDPRVGVPAAYVVVYMHQFELRCADLFNTFLKLQANPTNGLAPELVLLRFVKVACELLEFFLTIHPYANGNGHTARLFIWILLGRAGYTPAKWPLDESPAYGPALSAYRNGQKRPLEEFLLDAIIGNPA